MGTVVHATFLPLRGQSYREVRSDLSMSILPWMKMRRTKGEGLLGYWARRTKQWVRRPRSEPMHGTPSDATGLSLELRDYKNIYPNEEGLWFCICDTECKYALDVQIPLGGHTMTVHQGVAFTTADFSPDETEVVNVRRLDAERTREFRSYARYKKD